MLKRYFVTALKRHCITAWQHCSLLCYPLCYSITVHCVTLLVTHSITAFQRYSFQFYLHLVIMLLLYLDLIQDKISQMILPYLYTALLCQLCITLYIFSVIVTSLKRYYDILRCLQVMGLTFLAAGTSIPDLCTHRYIASYA